MKYSILALLVVTFFCGCATDTGDPGKDRRGRVTNAVAAEAAKVAWSFLLNSGESYLRGRNGQDAASAAFGAAVQSYDGAAGLSSIIRAAAGPQAARVAEAAYLAADPRTPAEKAAVANTVGAAFQQVANATAK